MAIDLLGRGNNMPTPTEYVQHWGWVEIKSFLRFLSYSITTIAAFVGLWLTLDLPRVASKDYVNGKFQVAVDSSKVVQFQLNAVRLQINKMTRQTLEAEKYRLTLESKTNNAFDVQKRLQDLNEELEDVRRDRDNLINPK